MKTLCVILAMFCLSSCAMFDNGLGVSPTTRIEAMTRCPFCKKQISDQDRKCPFCGRDVNYDLGNDMVGREVQRISDDRDGR